MNAYREDASAAYFFTRELERIKSKLYETRYPQLKGRAHFPPGSEPSGPGAETFTHRVYDMVGTATIVKSYSKDWPQVSVKASEFTSKIQSLGDSYSYSFQDVRAAMFANKPLTVQEAMAARKAIAEREDELIYYGDAAEGLIGVLNHPNIPIVGLPHPVNSTSTPDEIIDVFNTLINTPMSLTRGTESVNTVLMPIGVHTYIKSKRIPDINLTILKFLEETHKEVEFDSTPRLEGVGTGGTDVLLAYRRDEEHVYTEIASDFEQLPPDDNGVVTTIRCHERFGGVVIPYPLSFIKGELPAA